MAYVLQRMRLETEIKKENWHGAFNKEPAVIQTPYQEAGSVLLIYVNERNNTERSQMANNLP